MSAKKHHSKFRSPIIITALTCILLLFIYFLCFTDHDLLPAYNTPLRDNIAEFHIIDVGQGDSILLRSENTNILIDAGPNSSEEKLISYIKGLDITKLDMLVLTHPHEDHIGGADGIIRNFEVGSLIMPDITSGSKTFEKLLDAIEEAELEITVPNRGERFECGDFEFTVLAPDNHSYKDLNNYSIILRADFKNISVMLTGDAEALSEAEVIDCFDASELKSHLLKIGHHGSSTSSSADFLNAVSPKLAAISCGENNEYGHPHPSVLKRLEELEVKVNRTDEDGTLVYRSDGTDIQLKTN